MKNIKQTIELLKKYQKKIEHFDFLISVISSDKEPLRDEIIEKVVNSEATDDDIKQLDELETEIKELKEKLKKNHDSGISLIIKEKEKELQELIDTDKNNVVELRELLERTNKLVFYIPIENNSEHNRREYEKVKNEKNKEGYRNKLIFDGKNVILQDYNGNEIEKVSYVEFGKEMFFDMIKDICADCKKFSMLNCEPDEINVFNIKNHNNLSIANIIFKYCRNNNIITLNEIIEYCSKNNIDPTNEKFVSIFCEIGDAEVVKYCIKSGSNLNKIRNINRLIYDGGNYELIHLLEDIGIEYNLDCFLGACANNDLNLVSYLLNNDEYSKDNLIESFSVIKDPRIADIILKELSNRNIDINTVGILSEDITIKKAPLHLAMENNHMEIVKYLLNEKLTGQKIDINKQVEQEYNGVTEKTETALNYAIENKNKQMIELLLKNPDIDVNLENSAAFYCAVESNDNEIIDLFLKHPKIDLSEKEQTNINPEERTLFFLAVEKNNIKLAKILLSQPNTNINVRYKEIMRSGYFEMVPLHYAIDNNSAEMVELLLSQPNIDVNAKFKYYYNKKDQVGLEIPILCYVMKFKSDSYVDNVRDYSKTTNPRIVELLLSKPNIDVNAKRISYYRDGNKESEETPLYMATILPRTKEDEEKLKAYEIVKLLLSCPNLNIEAKSLEYDETGNVIDEKMLFYEAIRNGNVEVANFLLPYNRDIDINKKYKIASKNTEIDVTLLYEAINSNVIEIVEFLLTNYPNIDVNTERIVYYENGNIKKRETPIYTAIFYDDKELIESLIKNPNLDIDKKYIEYDEEGNIKEEETILYSATRSLRYGKEIFELVVNEKIRRIKEKKNNLEEMKKEIIKQRKELNEIKRDEKIKDALDEIKKYEEKLNNIESEINF